MIVFYTILFSLTRAFFIFIYFFNIYRDRIVHQWYVEEFIKPFIVPKFINFTFACISNRGTHKANDYIQHQMQIFKRNYGDFWVLKCDIRKFFSLLTHIFYIIL